MITITEISPPRKVSGISSFLIQFPFDQRIVDAIKTLSTYNYDKKDYTWEIPVECIAKALDTLTFLDEITLRTLPDHDIKIINNKNLNPAEFPEWLKQFFSDYGLD